MKSHAELKQEHELTDLDIVEEQKLDLCTCYFCRIEAPYDEIVETDHLDSTGHDSFIMACKNVSACQERQYGNR